GGHFRERGREVVPGRFAGEDGHPPLQLVGDAEDGGVDVLPVLLLVPEEIEVEEDRLVGEGDVDGGLTAAGVAPSAAGPLEAGAVGGADVARPAAGAAGSARSAAAGFA